MKAICSIKLNARDHGKKKKPSVSKIMQLTVLFTTDMLPVLQLTRMYRLFYILLLQCQGLSYSNSIPISTTKCWLLLLKCNVALWICTRQIVSV